MNFEKATIFTVAEMGTLDQLKKKLQCSKLNEVNANEETLLHMAIRGKKTENIDFLLELITENAENKALLNMQTKKGETPLAYLVSLNDNDFILKYAQKLLEAGADINIKDSWGNNPFWTAVINCDYEDYSIIKMLAQYKPDILSKNNAGRSTMDIAVEDKNKELLNIFNTII